MAGGRGNQPPKLVDADPYAKATFYLEPVEWTAGGHGAVARGGARRWRRRGGGGVPGTHLQLIVKYSPWIWTRYKWVNLFSFLTVLQFTL